MEKLRITQEYKFTKGGSVFYISEGQKLRVRLSDGNVCEGTLIEVGGVSECFDVDAANGLITIDCEKVVDIMPI